MTATVPTWKCPRCGSTASAGHRFCRQCGFENQAIDATGETRIRPAMRPVSRALIVVIIVVFAVLGGLIALLVDDIRDDSPDQPTPSTAASGAPSSDADMGSGTRPITSTD